MGQAKTPGLIKRGGLWHIDKVIRGIRVCKSTGTSDIHRAQEVLARRSDEAREAVAQSRAGLSNSLVHGREFRIDALISDAGLSVILDLIF